MDTVGLSPPLQWIIKKRDFSVLVGMAKRLWVYFVRTNVRLDKALQQWDLNNGQVVRNFTAHGAQLAAIAVRPIASGYTSVSPSVITAASDSTAGASQLPPPSSADTKSDVDMGESSLADAQRPPVDSDAKSDISFDPLFDDEPETEISKPEFKLAMPTGIEQQPAPSRLVPSTIPPPKNAPPLLDPTTYATYSPDLLLTASIDGQVIVWDRRVHSPGTGVGRLWMSDKTPPWCLSVGTSFTAVHLV